MMWTLWPFGVAHEYTSIIAGTPCCSRCASRRTVQPMLDAIKRWISGGPPGPDWAGVSGWAQKQGYSFKRAKDDQGFVIDGAFGTRPWRLEWGPPQRAYIPTTELRLRMELQLPSDLQMLVMS